MITVNLKCELADFLNDVPEVVRAFSPYIVCDETALETIALRYTQNESRWRFDIDCSVSENSSIRGDNTSNQDDLLDFKRKVKRAIKVFLYRYCKNLTGISLPYGSLTGVRPTKLFRELEERGEPAYKLFIVDFEVTKERADLVQSIVRVQNSFYDKESTGVDIFVNIPFCPTRCKYCSFISTEIGRVRKQIPDYIRAVKAEISQINQEVEANRLNVRAIYVGGGTPTSLEAEELSDMLGGLSHYGVEFTVEAGRPDSITESKLKALKELNVTRISVNPQTLKDETLVLIGRSHTSSEFFNAYNLARSIGFDINVDLIAGLPEETFEDFSSTLQGVLALNPENITVHTLALKRGSTFRNEGASKSMEGSVKQMVDYARRTLIASGYEPYYMYRQKNMADNLENVGFAKPGKACLYNVDYMEETSTILSAGAGAMSKYVYKSENRLERTPNPKGLNEYLARKADLLK